MSLLEQVLRLTTAAVAGGALGLNRRVRGKSAGLRTHALVSLGAAVVVLSADLYVTSAGGDRGAVTRALQGVVSGIGFIGAGAILKGGGSQAVRGLTTAASIWLAASVGAASGAGNEGLALIAVVLAFVVLVGGQHVERATRRFFEPPKGIERRAAERRAAARTESLKAAEPDATNIRIF
jgi:putative Mg2+ transporter-C (MgtC) family protein